MLAEMMLAIILFGVFMLVAVQVLRTSLRASHAADEAAAAGLRFDGAVGQLRRDLWGASKVEAVGAKGVRLERPGQSAVTWSVSDDGSLVRTLAQAPAADDETDAERREWPGVAKHVQFQVNGAVVSLVESDAPGSGGRRVSLVSQVLLAGGGGGAP
jgi:hypothetical protein